MTHKVLITGATGFVGGHILIHLLQAKKEIRATYRTANFNELKLICQSYGMPFREVFDRVEWVKVDLLDKVALDRALFDIDEMYHCAAMINFDPSSSDSITDININSTQNVVDACLRKETSKLCYISSIGALNGKRADGMTDEDCFHDNQEESSAYSYSKYKAELCIWNGIEQGLKAVILNPGIIIGPGSLNKGGNLLIENIRKGLFCYTSGATGYIDVRDVASIALEAMDKEVFGQRIICVSENLSYKSLFTKIAEKYEKRAPFLKLNKAGLWIVLMAVNAANLFMKKKSSFTKNTLRSSLKRNRYDNKRLISLLNPKLTPITNTIEDTIRLQQNEKK